MLSVRVEHINPFIEAVYELFQTTLSGEVSRGEIGVCSGGNNPRDIMALIDMSGTTRGTVALSFPTPTALAIVSKLQDTRVTIVDKTVYDGIAELVNTVAGKAKAKLAKEDETPMDLSLPTVVSGANYSVDYSSQTVWLDVPFTSSFGEFSLRVTFEESPV